MKDLLLAGSTRSETGRVPGCNAIDVRLLRTDSNAGGEVVRPNLGKAWFNIFASLNHIGAACVEPTPRFRWIQWRRNVSLRTIRCR